LIGRCGRAFLAGPGPQDPHGASGFGRPQEHLGAGLAVFCVICLGWGRGVGRTPSAFLIGCSPDELDKDKILHLAAAGARTAAAGVHVLIGA